MTNENLCQCGHDWNFHNVLDNEQCHEMNCSCKEFTPQKRKMKNRIKLLEGLKREFEEEMDKMLIEWRKGVDKKVLSFHKRANKMFKEIK